MMNQHAFAGVSDWILPCAWKKCAVTDRNHQAGKHPVLKLSIYFEEWRYVIATLRQWKC
ncbi:MAG: hypothetical protein JWO59_1937, partial [Chloroflexi bacterium]|nr:hypothetical protein [Chloroflexota bacterium]